MQSLIQPPLIPSFILSLTDSLTDSLLQLRQESLDAREEAEKTREELLKTREDTLKANEDRLKWKEMYLDTKEKLEVDTSSESSHRGIRKCPICRHCSLTPHPTQLTLTYMLKTPRAS